MDDKQKNQQGQGMERDKSHNDPEREMPDPEQVEKDRKEAEKVYGDGNRKEPAA